MKNAAPKPAVYLEGPPQPRPTSILFLLCAVLLAPPSSSAFLTGRSTLGPSSSSRVAASSRDEAAAPAYTRTDAEWRQELSPAAYAVLRQAGTEPPNTSRLNDLQAGVDEGAFACAGCGRPLFLADAKFESGTGWPSFSAPLDGDAVELGVDFKALLPRTEVRCRSCQGHLGHVFPDGPRPTGQRYCLNGVALRFVRDGRDPELRAEVVERARRAAALEAAGGVVVRQPPAAVLPGAAADGILAGLFLSTFVQRVTAGELSDVGAAGPRAVLAFFPLVVGTFLAVSALRKLASLR